MRACVRACSRACACVSATLVTTLYFGVSMLIRAVLVWLSTGTQPQRRREDGTARDKLDESIMRQMCDTLLMQMGF